MSPVRKYFRDLSITYKIVLIIFVTSGVSLAIAGASFVTYDVRAYKESLVKDLSVEADIIAANSTAALAFDDYDSASETLSALRLEDRILIAYLLSAEGLTFATYARDDVGDQHRKPVLREEGYAFQDDYLAVRRSIVFDGEILGHIYIESDLGGVRERIGNFVGTVAAISTTALIVVMLLTSRLQRIISGPMVVLAGVARDISRKKDYSVRAEKVANDEVGDLIDGFNEMLEQIEAQDAMLQNHRAELQDEVASQTAELRTVNERLLTSESRMRVVLDRRRVFRRVGAFAGQRVGNALGLGGHVPSRRPRSHVGIVERRRGRARHELRHRRHAVRDRIPRRFLQGQRLGARAFSAFGAVAGMGCSQLCRACVARLGGQTNRNPERASRRPAA
jgi:HAMP domain-containing protein